VAAVAAVSVRPLRPDDLSAVARIDAHHTGRSKRVYWRRTLGEYLAAGSGPRRVGLAAEEGGRLLGYLLGEVRAFEFGSEPCGWVFAVGVDPAHLRAGVASALLAEACRLFRRAGIGLVRTMVRRNDVPVLAFFRGNGFRGGAFVELERPLPAGR
jgi:ribosomal protein S18 acetylase RimI-like enzyme